MSIDVYFAPPNSHHPIVAVQRTRLANRVLLRTSLALVARRPKPRAGTVRTIGLAVSSGVMVDGSPTKGAAKISTSPNPKTAPDASGIMRD